RWHCAYGGGPRGERVYTVVRGFGGVLPRRGGRRCAQVRKRQAAHHRASPRPRKPRPGSTRPPPPSRPPRPHSPALLPRRRRAARARRGLTVEGARARPPAAARHAPPAPQRTISYAERGDFGEETECAKGTGCVLRGQCRGRRRWAWSLRGRHARSRRRLSM
ncbi:hypothetical protein DFH09DRAFT_1223305, partial [Mycena vulgaris]